MEVNMNDFDAFSDDWLLAGNAESTITTYGQILAKAPFELPGTLREAKSWLSKRRREGLSEASVVVYVRALRAFSRWWAEEYGQPDPLLKLEFPKVPQAAPGKIVSDDVIKQLRDACGIFNEETGRTPRRDRAILDMFIYTGMRRSELVALDVDDIDLTANRITIDPSKNGEGRVVPLHSDLRSSIKSYIRHERSGHRLADDRALFLGRKGRMRSDSVTSLLRRISERAGLAEPIGSHEFRRRFADQWVSGGGSDDHLMVIAGWKSPAMPARYRAANRKDQALEHYQRILDPQNSVPKGQREKPSTKPVNTKDGRIIRRSPPKNSD